MAKDKAVVVEEAKPKRFRTVGALAWYQCGESDRGGDCLFRVEPQPEHADTSAAKRWLTAQLNTDVIEPGDFMLVREVLRVSPRLETTRRVVL